MVWLTGHLLVASPLLRDPNFERTVVLIAQHDEAGALGLVLNRPTLTRLGDAWSKVSDAICLREDVLYHGGPCDGPLMVLHDGTQTASTEVVNGLHFTWEMDDVEKLVGANEGELRVFVGHSGWASGQLENEMNEGSWLTAPGERSDAFSNHDGLWDQVRRRIGRSELARDVGEKLLPEDPGMN